MAGSAQFENDKLSSKIVTFGRLSGTIKEKRITNIFKQFLTISIVWFKQKLTIVGHPAQSLKVRPLGLDAYFKILCEFS